MRVAMGKTEKPDKEDKNMKTQTMRHHRNDRKLYYPVDIDLLAADLEQRGIDIADITILIDMIVTGGTSQ